MFEMSDLLRVVLVICVCSRPTSCQNISNVKRLIKDKELNYDKSVRPVTNQSLPVTVNLAFTLLALQDINEVEQTITVSGVLSMQWTDEQMAWDPMDYGGLDQLTVDNSRFWTPSIVLGNSNDILKKIGDTWVPLRYFSNGIAYFLPGSNLQVSCTLDIRFYPWDRHVCYLIFNAWGFLPNEYILQNVTSEADTTYFYPNGAWNLNSASIEAAAIPDVGTYFTVILDIERQPEYVLANVIVPVIILSVLNLFIYCIPAESGERLSFSITLLLAIAVFLTIVADNLPKISTPMSILSSYLLTVLVVSNCVTLSIIYSLCLYHRDESKPVGGCWKRIVKIMKCRCTRGKRSDKKLHKHKYTTSIDQAFNNGSIRRGYDYSTNWNYLNHRRPMHLKTHPYHRHTSIWRPYNGVRLNGPNNPDGVENAVGRHEDDLGERVKWKDVSVAFDRICFVFFLLVLIVIKCITFVTIYTGLKNVTFDPPYPQL